MRTLCVKQPWADLIRDGSKTLEVRSWSTNYRGPLLITSSARASRDERALHWPACKPERLGVAVCLVQLVDVRTAWDDWVSADACGGFFPEQDQFCWVLESPVALAALPVRGALGLRTPGSELLRALATISGARARAALLPFAA